MAKLLVDIMNELGIKVCPVCGREYVGHSAISRKDNKTEICPEDGQKEAIEAFINFAKPQNRQ